MFRHGIATGVVAAVHVLAATALSSEMPGVSVECLGVAKTHEALFAADPQCASTDVDCLTVKYFGIRKQLLATDPVFQNCMKIKSGPGYVCEMLISSVLGVAKRTQIEDDARAACFASGGTPAERFYCTKRAAYEQWLAGLDDQQQNLLQLCGTALAKPEGQCWDSIAAPAMQSLLPPLATTGNPEDVQANLAKWFLTQSTPESRRRYAACTAIDGIDPVCLEKYVVPAANIPAVCGQQCRTEHFADAYDGLNLATRSLLNECKEYFPVNTRGYCHRFLVPGNDADRLDAINEMNAKCRACNCCKDKVLHLLAPTTAHLHANTAYQTCLAFFADDARTQCLLAAEPSHSAVSIACQNVLIPKDHAYCVSSKVMDEFTTLSAVEQKKILDKC